MPTRKQINEFAVKYLKRYSQKTTCGHEVEEGFADECFALGFVMDCGQSFTAAYPKAHAFYDYAHLGAVIDEVTDVQLLGSAIFSEWRYITHWSMGESLLSNKHRHWFIIAFSRLAALTAEEESKPNKIDRITLDYHRITKLKPRLPGGTSGAETEDYAEQLIIDRKSESIEYTKSIESECVVSHRYQIKKGVPKFLDSINTGSLFEDIEGDPPDAIEDPDEIRAYTITIDFRKKQRRIIRGSYDRMGLPEDWPEFIEELVWVMVHYGSGEIFRESVYFKEKRRASDYIFCSVEFTDGGKTYYYITEDDTIEVGDLVVVPAGKDDHTAIVEVVDIEYFQKDAAPFPVEKTKRIIRKCSEEDFEK